jgi:DnaJ family protein C protein 19
MAARTERALSTVTSRVLLTPSLPESRRLGPSHTQRALFHASTRSEFAGPLVAGLSVAVLALTARYGIEAYNRMAAVPVAKTSMVRKNYLGGFDNPMSRREASLILGCRESSKPEVVRDRHRKLLIRNHPDRGGSTLLSVKINEAKAVLLGEKSAAN